MFHRKFLPPKRKIVQDFYAYHTFLFYLSHESFLTKCVFFYSTITGIFLSIKKYIFYLPPSNSKLIGLVEIKNVLILGQHLIFI